MAEIYSYTGLKEDFPLAANWLENRTHTTALLSLDKSNIYPSAEEKIANAGGSEAMRPSFDSRAFRRILIPPPKALERLILRGSESTPSTHFEIHDYARRIGVMGVDANADLRDSNRAEVLDITIGALIKAGLLEQTHTIIQVVRLSDDASFRVLDGIIGFTTTEEGFRVRVNAQATNRRTTGYIRRPQGA